MYSIVVHSEVSTDYSALNPNIYQNIERRYDMAHYKHGIILAIVAFALVAFIPFAQADPITDPSLLSPNPTLINFEQFMAGPVNNPLVIGNVTFSTIEPEGGLDIRDITGYPADGTEVASMLLQTIPHYMHMVIAFLNPVSEVLLGWWDPNFPGNFLRAYGEDDSLLEEVELTDLGPPQGVHATWIGFKRPSPDISRIEIDPAIDPPYDHYGIDNIHYNTAVPPPQIIDIVIKPNSINLDSKGVVQVAVLTTTDFDATLVDPTTVEFAGASPTRWAIKDVDRDGDKDMLLNFLAQELVELDKFSTEATLSGYNTDGWPIEGTGKVTIITKGKK